jgi:H+/gluconate symporter-like permease
MLTPTDWKMVLLALAAIGALVLMITRFKVNPFISLLLASLLVGGGAVATGRLVKDAAGTEVPYTLLGVAKTF